MKHPFFLLLAICLLHTIGACSSKTDNAKEGATDSTFADSILYSSPQSELDTFSNTSFSAPQTAAPQATSEKNHKPTPDDAYHEGYDEGYSCGYEDRESGNGERASYDASTKYRKLFKARYQEGYEDGYSDGYLDGNNASEE